MTEKIVCLKPNWPAPLRIRAYSTTRLKGFSQPPFNHLNLSYSVGEDARIVDKNHLLLREELQLPEEPNWLNQVHGTEVIHLDSVRDKNPDADASYTHLPNRVCVVRTADCLPILICNKEGTEIAAIHAGWRGLLAGVIQNTLQQLSSPKKELLAWIGPAISAEFFEINEQIQVAFVMNNQQNKQYIELRHGHWFADLFQIARNTIKNQGIEAIYGENLCTYKEADLFYSHRRDRGQTGRMATLIWISNH